MPWKKHVPASFPVRVMFYSLAGKLLLWYIKRTWQKMWILALELPSDSVWNMLCCNAPPLCALGGSLPSLLLWQTTCPGQLMKGLGFGWRFRRRVRNCRDSKAAGSWESPPSTSSTAEYKPKWGPGCELSSPTSDELPQARLYFLDLPR